jgi:competence protein ComGC
MKSLCAKTGNHALTLVELLVVIAVLVLLYAMTDTGVSAHAKLKAQQISCANNLKQLGYAFKIWAGDNNDEYPMDVSITNGGAMEAAATGNFVAFFQVMSNEICTPKMLFCPGDSQRTYASDFGPGFSATNISYFIDVDSSITNQKNLLAGDDNLLINNSPVKPGLLAITAGTPVSWDSSRHQSVKAHSWFSTTKSNLGNIVLGDGNVRSTDNSTLANDLTQTGLATNRLAIP